MRIVSFTASNSVNNSIRQPEKPIINASNTGYASLIGMGLTCASGMSRNKTVRSSHKYLSILTAAATILHLVKVLSHPHKPSNDGELNG